MSLANADACSPPADLKQARIINNATYRSSLVFLLRKIKPLTLYLTERLLMDKTRLLLQTDSGARFASLPRVSHIHLFGIAFIFMVYRPDIFTCQHNSHMADVTEEISPAFL